MSLIYVLVVIGFFSNLDPETMTASFASLDVCQKAGEDFLSALNASTISVDDVHVACLPSVEV